MTLFILQLKLFQTFFNVNNGKMVLRNIFLKKRCLKGLYLLGLLLSRIIFEICSALQIKYLKYNFADLFFM